MFEKNLSLLPFNTFGIACSARYYICVQTQEELLAALSSEEVKREPLLILGGGSNVLFTNDRFEGVVLHIQTKGIALLSEDETGVNIRVEAGEKWDDFVNFCIQKGWGGIENLSDIPGTVGAAPIQNIGAYGVEVGQSIKEIETIEIRSGKRCTFDQSECHFGYRDSIFKRNRGKYVITSVVFRLTKNTVPNTSYGAIQEELNRMQCLAEPSIADVGQAVSRIRKAKLPNHLEIGNAGSFFMNPIIDETSFQNLQQRFPDIPSFLLEDGTRKLAAAWMIERAGWKGKALGKVAMHDQQALVMVNLGGATAAEVLALSDRVIADVHALFCVTLQSEVNRY